MFLSVFVSSKLFAVAREEMAAIRRRETGMM